MRSPAGSNGENGWANFGVTEQFGGKIIQHFHAKNKLIAKNTMGKFIFPFACAAVTNVTGNKF